MHLIIRPPNVYRFVHTEEEEDDRAVTKLETQCDHSSVVLSWWNDGRMKLEPSGQSSSITFCRRLNYFLAGNGSTVQPDEKTIVRVLPEDIEGVDTSSKRSYLAIRQHSLMESGNSKPRT